MAKFEKGTKIRIKTQGLAMSGNVYIVDRLDDVDGYPRLYLQETKDWIHASHAEPINSPQQGAAPQPRFQSKVEREEHEARVPPTLIPDLRAENAALRSQVDRLTKERDAARNDFAGCSDRWEVVVARVAADRDFWRQETKRLMPAAEFKRLVEARERNR
jgi:hypothetical protein